MGGHPPVGRRTLACLLVRPTRGPKRILLGLNLNPKVSRPYPRNCWNPVQCNPLSTDSTSEKFGPQGPAPRAARTGGEIVRRHQSRRTAHVCFVSCAEGTTRLTPPTVRALGPTQSTQSCTRPTALFAIHRFGATRGWLGRTSSNPRHPAHHSRNYSASDPRRRRVAMPARELRFAASA